MSLLFRVSGCVFRVMELKMGFEVDPKHCMTEFNSEPETPRSFPQSSRKGFILIIRS